MRKLVIILLVGAGVACSAGPPPTDTPAVPSATAAASASTSEAATKSATVSASPTAKPAANKLAKGGRVLVGAGFIFEEGEVVSHECARDGAVADGAPCVVVKKSTGTGDTSVAIVHPIEGHIVKPDKALGGGRHLVCGGSGTWQPCRTVIEDRGHLKCQVVGGKPASCLGYTMVEVSPATTKAIRGAFAEAGP